MHFNIRQADFRRLLGQVMSGIVIIEGDEQMRSLLTEWLTADRYRVHGSPTTMLERQRIS